MLWWTFAHGLVVSFRVTFLGIYVMMMSKIFETVSKVWWLKPPLTKIIYILPSFRIWVGICKARLARKISIPEPANCIQFQRKQTRTNPRPGLDIATRAFWQRIRFIFRCSLPTGSLQALRFAFWHSSARGKARASYKRTRPPPPRLFLTRSSSSRALLLKPSGEPVGRLIQKLTWQKRFYLIRD